MSELTLPLGRLVPGDRIAHYEIISELAHGGMGIVYRATDERLRRDVALKCPWPEFASNPTHRLRFLREVRTTATLSHPHIVPLFEAFEHEGRPWLALQLIEGETLRSFLQREGKVPLPRVLQWSVELAGALAAAHDRRVLHRDLTPQNVLISNEGEAYLTDFGLARSFSTESDLGSSDPTRSRPYTQDGVAVGTPRYMSPEQLLALPLDERSDIYSLGIVIYEMCTGTIPFAASETGELSRRIPRDGPQNTPSPLGELPKELESVVRTTLQRKREERYQNCHDLRRDLEAARRRVESNDLPNIGPSRRGLWPKLAVSAVLSAALFVAFWFPRHGDRDPFLGIPRQLTTTLAWHGDPALSPDGRFVAYVSDETGNEEIWVLATDGGKPAQVTDDPARDYQPSWLPGTGSLLFTSTRGGTKSVWKSPMLGGGASLVVSQASDAAVSPDGTLVAFSRAEPSSDYRIHVAPLHEPERAVQLTDERDGLWDHWQPAFSPDGRSIYYSAHGDLWVVPAAGGETRQLTSGEDFDTGPAPSTDGRVLFFSSDRQGTIAIWRMPASGGAPTRVTTGTGSESAPSLGGGRRLAYGAVVEDFDLVVMDLDSGAETTLSEQRRLLSPAIARDRSYVVYNTDRGDGRFSLWRIDLRAEELQGSPFQLTDLPGQSTHAVISPDGRWIAFYRILDNSRDIWVISSSGGPATQITTDPAADIQPAWSPDGGFIAFSSERPRVDGSNSAAASQIWMVPVADGKPNGAPFQVTRGPVVALWPTFSPDGKEIAYVGTGGGRSDLWMARVDGAVAARSLGLDAEVGVARFSPIDGKLLVAGVWRDFRTTIKEVSAETGEIRDLPHPPRLQPGNPWLDFDISPDGRVIAFARQKRRGSIWILEAQPGSY